MSEAIGAYAHADWRASGVALEVFWRDVLGWCVAAANYGLLHRREQDLLRRAGVGRDLDLVETILTDLVSDYTAARMAWAVEEALAPRAYAVVAAGAISRFEPVATAIGARSWVALAALVDAVVVLTTRSPGHRAAAARRRGGRRRHHRLRYQYDQRCGSAS